MLDDIATILGLTGFISALFACLALLADHLQDQEDRDRYDIGAIGYEAAMPFDCEEEA